MKDLVVVENVGKSFRKKKVLDDLSFKINKGDIVGLIGPNGAGKTTLMKLMCGLLKLDEGNIYIDGMSAKKCGNTVCRKIGAVIETPAAYEQFSGYKNLKLLSYLYPNVTDEDIKEVVNIVDLEDAIHDKVKTYSLGMKQRLGIAMALLNNPSLLILDEPMNGLDIDGVRDLRELFKYLSKEKGVTIIISSHILGELDKVCDNAIFLKKGKLVAQVEKEKMQSDGFEEEYVRIMGSEVRKYGNY